MLNELELSLLVLFNEPPPLTYFPVTRYFVTLTDFLIAVIAGSRRVAPRLQLGQLRARLLALGHLPSALQHIPPSRHRLLGSDPRDDIRTAIDNW